MMFCQKRVKMNSKEEELKRCKKYKDFTKFLKNEGFEHARTSGGHMEFTKENTRSIPIPSHGTEPSKNLRHRIIKQIMGAMGFLCLFVFIFTGFPNIV